MGFIQTLNAAILILIILKINPIQSYGQKFTSGNNNVFYIENEQKYSWFDAFVYCIEMNMTLVTIDSSTKSNEINSLVRNNFGKVNLWIGGIMGRLPYRHFIWVDTKKPFTYTFWQGNNPDFYGDNEYCAHIGWGSNLEWNDIHCNNHMGFICEPSQQHQQNEKIQQDLEREKTKEQELQKQLQQKVQTEQELQRQMLEKQNQQDQFKLELENLKKTAEHEKIKHLQLQQTFEQENKDLQDKFKQQLEKFKKLEEDFKDALEKQLKLQQDLQEQQNLKDLAEEELQKLKDKQTISSNDENKKYRDIIFHFHQHV